MDGDNLTFDNEFDAVFSNAALHWMTSPDKVVSGINRALKPGGRFVGELGGRGNIAALARAMALTFDAHPEFGPLNNPKYFPDADAYRAVLENAGFKVNTMALFERPTRLSGDIREWLITFTFGITASLTDAQKKIFQDEVTARLEAQLHTPDGWVLDYVRLRFRACKA